MKRLLSIAFGLLLIAGCTTNGSPTTPVADPSIPVKLTPVNSYSGNEPIQVSGLLATENEARLSFKIGGVIDQVLVQEGQQVSRGQLLATLKSAEISAQVQQVQLALEKAKRDYQRAYNLYHDSVGTLEQMQNARTGVDIARQNLQQVSFNQQYSKIYAPANGFIITKNANAGELASPGAPVLTMNLVSAKSPWIMQAGVSDKTWAAIQTGDKATIEIEAYPGHKFDAVVTRKALASNPASGSFLVELTINLEDKQPAVGMYANARIIPSKQRTGYNIPYEALLEANGRKGYVFVSNDKRTVKQVEVTIGSINNSQVVIEKGLEGYAWVVTSGSPYLADNVSIRAVE